MATRTANTNYHCFNDCVMSGCPGHEAKLYVQTTSDAIKFDDGRDNVHYFDPTTLEVLIKLLKEVDYMPRERSA